MKKLMRILAIVLLLSFSVAGWAAEDYGIKSAPDGQKEVLDGSEAIPLDDNGADKYALISAIITLAAVPTAASLSVDDLITLSGVLTGATHLGTFTGTTIPDSQTIKAALQALETAFEALSIPTASSLSVDDLITLSGVLEGATNLGTFTGTTIPDSQTIKAAIQALETAFEALPGGHDAVTLNAAADAVFGLSTQQITLDTQAANKVWAGPESGDAAAPTFRLLVSSDIPDNAANTSGTAANLSGTPTLPNGTAGTTQSQADNSTKIATTAYVDTGLSGKSDTTHNHYVAPSELTISGGSITATQLMHTVDTEEDAATDNLDTITAGSSGQWLYLRAEHTARTVVLRHNQGNIYTGGQNVSLTDTTRFVILFYDNTLTKWVVVNSIPDVLAGMDFGGFTANRAIATDASGYLTESTATDTELGYLSGVSSAIQTQINGKQATVTEGSLADGVVVSADIKDDTITPADIDYTVETEYLPISYAIDGASAPDALATVTSGTDKVDARTFAGDADEDVLFTWKVPLDFDATSGVKFRALCVVTSGTTPSAETWQFEMQGFSLGDGDALDGTLGTAQTSNSGSRSDAQYDLVHTAWSSAMTSTHITDLAAGETVVFKLYRDVDDTDTYEQPVGVVGVELKYKREHSESF